MVDSFPLGDELAIGQRAVFRGSISLSDSEEVNIRFLEAFVERPEDEWFLFSNDASLSLLNRETGEWRVVTSPVFSYRDATDDGWLSSSGRRMFFIDGSQLTAVNLVDAADEALESTATFSMSDETLVSRLSAEILWASDAQVIFATGEASWIVDAPNVPGAECVPQLIEDRGGVGIARLSC